VHELPRFHFILKTRFEPGKTLADLRTGVARPNQSAAVSLQWEEADADHGPSWPLDIRVCAKEIPSGLNHVGKRVRIGRRGLRVQIHDRAAKILPVYSQPSRIIVLAEHQQFADPWVPYPIHRANRAQGPQHRKGTRRR
jgi:hypothetical protein